MTFGFVSLLILDGLQALCCGYLLAQKPQKNVLRYSKLLVILALISVLSAGGIGVYCLRTVSSRVALILDIVFSLSGGGILFVYCRWRITYGDSRFVVHPCIGHKRIYSMADIYGMTDGPTMTTLHLRCGKLRLDKLVRGREDFIEEAEYYYRYVLYRGYALPDIPNKLFRNHVKEPRSFVAAFLLIDLFYIGCIILFASLTHYEMYPTDTMISVELSDYTAQWKDETLYLYTGDLRQPFYVNRVPEILPAEQYTGLRGNLSRGVPLQVIVEKKNYDKATKNDCNYIKIRGLRCADGQLLISEEAVIRSIRLESRSGWIFLSIIFILQLCFEAFFCYIVIHATKYPRLFRLLVRDNWRNF